MSYTIEAFKSEKEYLEELTSERPLTNYECGKLQAYRDVENLILFGVGCSKPIEEKQILDSEKMCVADKVVGHYAINEKELNNLIQTIEDKTLS